MNDIPTAREQLLACERRRPRPGDSFVYWDDGRWWQQAFDELTACERALDAAVSAQVGDVPSGTDATARLLMRLSDEVEASANWYGWLLGTLRDSEGHWSVDQQDRPQAPQSLYTHMAMLDAQVQACGVRRALIALEYLEDRRVAHGGLGPGMWQAAWSDLNAALRAQNAAYKRWYNLDLPEHTRAERLAALERISRMQAATSERWTTWTNVDRAGLDADMQTLATFIAHLRPARGGGANVPALVLAGIAVLLIALLAGRGGGAPGEDAPTADPTAAVPTVAAPTAGTGLTGASQPQGDPRAEAEQHNAAGVALLREGRWQEAIGAFDRAIGLAPDWHEPYNNKAFCLYELGDRETAIRAWGLALQLNPQSADANAGLGMALAAAGERTEGQQHYDRAVALDPLYRDASRLRSERFWSERAIADSAPLRGEGAPTPTIYLDPKGAP